MKDFKLIPFVAFRNPFYYRRGLKHYRKGAWKKAKKYFEQSVQDDPNHAPSFFKLGMCYFHLKKYNLAFVSIQRAIQLAPDRKEWKVQFNQVSYKLKTSQKKESKKSSLSKKIYNDHKAIDFEEKPHAFVVNNTFQLRLFLPILRNLKISILLLDDSLRSDNIDLSILVGCNVFVVKSSSSVIKQLDGCVSSFNCQTYFTGLSYITSSVVVMLQYGLAKEKYNYGAWRRMADAVFCFGEYSHQKFLKHTTSIITGPLNGYEQLIKFNEKDFDPSKDLTCKHVLVLPTWGAISTLESLVHNVDVLVSMGFTITIKPHHNDYKKVSELLSLEQSVVVAKPDDDTFELIRNADCIISDYSGAIFDAVLFDKPVILFQPFSNSFLIESGKIDAGCLSINESHKIGSVAKDLDELYGFLISFASGNVLPLCDEDLKSRLFDISKDASFSYLYHLNEVVEKHRVSGSSEESLSIRNAFNSKDELATQKLLLRSLKRNLASVKKDYKKLEAECFSMSAFDYRKKSLPFLVDVTFEKLIQSVRSFFAKSTSKEKVFDLQSVVKSHKVFPSSTTSPEVLKATSLKREIESLYANAEFEALRKMINLGVQLFPKEITRKAFGIYLDNGDFYSADSLFDKLKLHYGEDVWFHRAAFRYVSLKYSRRSDYFLFRKSLAENKLGDDEKVKDLVLMRDFTELEKSYYLSPVCKDVSHRLGSFKWFADIASKNESMDAKSKLLCVYQGEVITYDELPPDKVGVVEFFMPGTFWVQAEDWSGNRELVNDIFKKLLSCFLNLKEFVIVPRWHFHLKHYLPLLNDSVTVSYHTIKSDFQNDSLHVKFGPLPGFFSIDNVGYAGFSSVSKITLEDVNEYCSNVSFEELDDFSDFLKKKYIDSNLSKYSQVSLASEIPSNKYVFVALQVLNDEVAKLARCSQADMLAKVVQHYSDSSYDVVIKRHPMCKSVKVSALLEELGKQEHVIISNGSVHELLAKSEVVYTINSGVGLEALIHDKPVVVFGSADYQCAAIYGDLNNFATVDDVLFDKFRMNNRKFLYYFFNHYLCSTSEKSDKIASYVTNLLLKNDSDKRFL
ncbi:capsular polysaccharide export protein, LipB/KpsS family [Vreelandella stevensii]|uniref:capsular polysaccharide export protein, LipB/KpsS family n=1 Tax=Vreelandella stevensii TaxID=502821 RepID=UPI00403AE232